MAHQLDLFDHTPAAGASAAPPGEPLKELTWLELRKRLGASAQSSHPLER